MKRKPRTKPLWFAAWIIMVDEMMRNNGIYFFLFCWYSAQMPAYVLAVSPDRSTSWSFESLALLCTAHRHSFRLDWPRAHQRFPSFKFQSWQFPSKRTINYFASYLEFHLMFVTYQFNWSSFSTQPHIRHKSLKRCMLYVQSNKYRPCALCVSSTLM